MLEIPWLVFPLVLAVLALGCGLLLERAAGMRLPGVLLLPAGLAVIVVVGLFPIMSDATAELAVPVIVLLAAAGLALSPPWRRGSPDWAAFACAVAVFCAYAAPIVLSGEATVAGYPAQRDNATYLGLVDRFMEHGRSLGGLEHGEYRDLLEIVLPEGYPLGSLVPFGVGQKLVGQDPAWLLQPYLAFVAAMLALSLYALVARVVPSRAVRAAVAFVASQPALLYALAFWAGIKELSAAWVLALIGALLVTVLRDEARGRALLPLSVATGATIGILSFAGAIWIIPSLVAALVLIVRRQGGAVAWRQAAAFLVLVAVVAIPSLALITEFWRDTTSADITGEKLVLLVNSLSPRQIFGVWPAGDFQATPGAVGVTNVVVGLVIVSAAAGLIWAVRRRAWELAVYVGGLAVAALAVAVFGSPWIDAKAFAIVSPAVVLIALVGALMVPTGNRRVAGAAVASAIAAGVVWSNVLAYHDVDLAPRDRLRELQRVADRVDGEGRTLLVEDEPYASRHFLREANLVTTPYSLSLNVVQDPGGGGTRLDRQARTTDTEQYEVQEILQYRTIVRRTSGVSSRPSSAFRLAWRGHYYEVWKSPLQPERVVDHVALGTDTQPASIPKCSYVLAVAVHAGPRGRVATVERPAVTIVNLPRTPVWRPKLSEREDPVPDGLRSGTMHARAVVPVTDRYTIWITGAFHRRIELLVDGEPVTKPRREVNGEVGSFYLRLGSRRLTAGSHSVELRYDDEGPLRPGTGGHAAIAPVQTQPNLLSFGPLALQREDVDPPITYVPRSRARALCGKRLDWLEPIVSR